MTADDVTLTEAERCHHCGATDQACIESDGGCCVACRATAGCTHSSERPTWDAHERILADRLAQVTARAERAEAQVERVRGLAAEWDVTLTGYDCADELLAVLDETADSDSEPYVPPQSDEQGELAPGGQDESAGLSVAVFCDPRCVLGSKADHPGWSAYRCIDENGRPLPFDETDDMEDQ